MFHRILGKYLIALTKKYPVITLTGPRQAGKTFLLRHLLAETEYRSLEDPDVLEFALNDPRGFLNVPGPLIIDEAQKAPKLFSYIQGIADQKNKPGLFFLSGSQNFLLMERISQSLAGRTAVLHLLPLATEELKPKEVKVTDGFPYALILKGGYPRLWAMDITPSDFYPPYIATYLERDLRSLKAVQDLTLFQRFLRLCAGRAGQEINLSAIALGTGVSYNTIQAWISILEASFIIFRLPPYYKNFNKRVIKNSKLYFYDTGLLSYLLGIRQAKELQYHQARGVLFENFIVSEVRKLFTHRGHTPPLFFWRDQTGHEIDLILEYGGLFTAVEIKAAETISTDHARHLRWFAELAPVTHRYVVNCANNSQTRADAVFLPWESFLKVSRREL